MAKRVGGFIGQDGLNAPDEPTNVTGSAGDGQVDVSFTAPSDEGGAAVSGYRVTDSTGAHGASGTSSPITVSGLTNDTEYTFRVWAINPFGWSQPSGVSGGVTPARQIGLFGGASGNVINKIIFTTTGNATDFGDLTVSRSVQATAASATRGVFIGAGNSNVIDYVTIETEGNATDFGDVSSSLLGTKGCSSSTRGVFGGGTISGNVSTALQYITIATTGNGVSFGSLTVGRSSHAANVMSPTRGCFSGGQGQDGSPVYNTIDYVTIASAGNASDFGDLGVTTRNFAGASSSTRGVFAGGVSSDASTRFNTISYVTIASTGNATDFGDLTSVSSNTGGGAGGVRAVFQMGQIDSSGYNVNTLSYITIATTGNATDFGDSIAEAAGHSFLSNAHGGLA